MSIFPDWIEIDVGTGGTVFAEALTLEINDSNIDLSIEDNGLVLTIEDNRLQLEVC